MASNLYLIWSNEHRAWWAPNCCGYTTDVVRAGRYERAEAISIAGTARGGWERGKNPDEIALPEADAMEQAMHPNRLEAWRAENAAPELLEAAQFALELIETGTIYEQQCCGGGGDCGCRGATYADEAEHFLRAAISRARGDRPTPSTPPLSSDEKERSDVE